MIEGWQPIETAPKDGTEILGSDGVARTSIQWDGEFLDRWELAWPGAYAEDVSFYPTHWMPLPDPPKV